MSEKHSKLPWIAHDDEEWGYISIDDNEGRYAASVEYNDTDDPRFSQFWNKSVMKANAELIVKAVNAMPELVSILTDMLNIVTGQNKDYQIDGAYEDDARHNYPKRNHRIKELIEQALALALAEVKP